VFYKTLHLLVAGEESPYVKYLDPSLGKGVHEHAVVALELFYIDSAIEVMCDRVEVSKLKLSPGVVYEDPLKVSGFVSYSEFWHDTGGVLRDKTLISVALPCP
jgi:hypothetical protein